ncbi:tuberin [Cydia amplana]|uniref:tuberin n=1 Tax=Cydia amplana TaxID=1869771 RepID=UPI002FE5A7EE
MSSRDRDTKSLQDKLKVFFKKGASAPLPAVNELVVTAELERELRSDAAPARRLRALRDLGDRVRITRIQQGGAERLWALMRDLLDDGCAESRHTALWFLRCIAEGQECAVMRTVLFRYLRETHAQHAAEDAPHRLSLLSTLTNAGKNIECFEEQIGEYLLEYMRSVGETGPALPELLALVINVVKYNATYLDEHVVHGIVDASCHLCAYSAEAGAVVSALALLEAVVAYSLLPRAALPAFVGALCRTVNLERHCQTSWKLMRSVLGADLGHAALQELAAVPAAAANNADGSDAAADAGAVRGAVFYINMALWGPRRVPSLRVSLLCVLPALLQAVSTNQPVVTYEVIQAIQSLVTRAPPDSLCAAWDVLLAVLAHAHKHDKSLEPANELIHTRLHALLTSIEQLHESGQYTGDTCQLLDLIDASAQDRPEASVVRLITLRCATLSPARAEWPGAALALGDKFVRRDARLGVRMHALQQLLAVVKRHRFLYEEEVVVGLGVPVLGWCSGGGADPLGGGADTLRAAAARAAADLAVLAAGDAATDLIDLLEKIMNRPFESEEPGESDPEPDLTDVTLAVSGLLEVFHAKLLRSPAAHAARACLVLLDHLDHALNHPRYPAQHAICRKKLLRSPAAHAARACLVLLDHLDHALNHPRYPAQHAICRKKLLRSPAAHAARACLVLLDHLDHALNHPRYPAQHAICRKKLLRSPAAHAARACLVLLDHLDHALNHPRYPAQHAICRKKLLRSPAAHAARACLVLLDHLDHALNHPRYPAQHAICRKKLLRSPAAHAARACLVLLDHLDHALNHPRYPAQHAICRKKLLRSPAAHAARACLVLLDHLDHALNHPRYPAQHAICRKKLLRSPAAHAARACLVLLDHLDHALNHPRYPAQHAICRKKLLRSPAAHAARACLVLLDHLDHALNHPRFHAQLLRSPAAHAARACLVLLDHLDHALNHPRYPAQHAICRKKILDMIFGLRANMFNSVGFCYDSAGSPVYGPAALRIKPLCSPSLLAEPLAARGHHPPPNTQQVPGTCILPVGRCARILTLALSREKEWSVLQHVLRALPGLLQSRALCVGRRAQDLDLLASTLCAMLSDRSLAFPECLRGQKVLVSELHAAVLPSLGALAPYHAFLEPLTQQRVVRCLLRYGMVLRTPAPYLAALTQFTLEARDTMVKLLPEVLLDLSKVSDTKLIAGPMLEFLSTLTRLPRVFASFVEDQYMSVFAILLPYTNPSRYNHYVVSLAHHVVAAWFLKCRLSYRRNFVRFIIHGLHNYIIMPREEQLNLKVHAPANEDSSNRKRSSSLGSRGVSAAPLGSGAGAARASAASASAAFHVELTETCVDLLARYTASACSVKPQRSDAAEWMFSGGQSMTWLVGHKLVTITTAGCSMSSIKQGMCDRCATLCRQHAESAASPLPPLALHDEHAKLVPPSDGSHGQNHNNLQVTNPPEIKRYSKHSLQHSRSTDNSASSSLSDRPDTMPSRQNSAEYNPIVEALNNFTQRFEKISKEVDTEEAAWSRAGELAAGACPCWCADWAEIHVRSPSGDVSWLMRVQNQMGWESQESSLQDVLALLAPAPASSASSGLGTDRTNYASESEGRSRSGSSASQAAHAQDLHKSSSDSVVAGERRPPHAATHCIGPPQQPQRMSTQPINIPGSPVRGAAHDDDMLLYVPEGKSRHPVRRSNSSPEMSSWKLPGDSPAGPEPPAADPALLILLPGTEPTQSQSLHATKKANKKSDMRVSCEAIPEEMSGSSPLAAPNPPPHPHLMTYNSDPGNTQSQSLHATKKANQKSDMRVSCEAIPEEMSGSSPLAAPNPPPHPHLMTYNSDPGNTQSQSLHATKKANQKSDMRVSCEAIPEEMSGSSPLAAPNPPPHPHLMTYNSDPGNTQSQSLHATKKANQKSDMRVSCEAIPEEMSGSSPLAAPNPPPHPHLMTYNSDPGNTQSQSLHATKKANQKSDMRVSCEAIPEEMSGSSPLAAPNPPPHPHLMTYNSDPGNTQSQSLHATKKANQKSDMRVSCEAIPEEMSGSSPLAAPNPPPHPHLMTYNSDPGNTQSQSLHATKKANQKSDMRVSCEAIPEEMSGSSPLAAPNPPPHPHLMTYNSDPGSGSAPEDGPAPQPIQKVASDSIVQGVAPAHPPAAAHAHKPAPAPAPPPPPPATVGSMRERDDLPPLSRSKRSNTISVMSPTRRHRYTHTPLLQGSSSATSTSSSGRSTAASSTGSGGGVTPSFVLLQLYHKMSTYPITPPVPGEVPSAQNPLAERPLLVSGVQHERTIKNLDRVPPIETYKVGVLYVGPGQQDNEVEVLKNEYGSVRYAEFLGQLGTLVSLAGSGAGLLEGAQQQPLFLNLEQGGKDGKYTYVWHDDVMQVLFHVATAMPVSAADPTCNEKRKYIGNDYVSIVYNDSGGDFPIQTIKGQFNLCIVVVEPFEHGLHRVHIKTKDERIRSKFLPHLDNCAHVVSDHCAATLARQLALHCALASHISQSLSMGGGSAPYASNSLERLRHIKRLRRRVEDERLAHARRAPKPYAPQGDTARRVAMDDFNDYT